MNYPSQKCVWRGGQGWAFRAACALDTGGQAQGSGWAWGLGRARVKNHADSMRRGRIGPPLGDARGVEEGLEAAEGALNPPPCMQPGVDYDLPELSTYT